MAMASVTVKTAAGADAGTVELDDAMFGIEPNVPVMHQVVTAQLAARRAGTQTTKTRAEVRGGGAKPWKQKGTGRARAGLHPLAALARRRRGPRPEAPQLRPAHPQEDDPPRPALGPVRPGRRRQGRRRRRLGLRRPEHQGRRRRPRRPRRRAAGSSSCCGPTTTNAVEELPQPARGPRARRRRAQRLRRAVQRLSSSSPRTTPAVDASPPSAGGDRRDGGPT